MDPSLIGAVTGTADMYGNRPIYIRTILHTLRINKVLWCHRRLVFFVDKKKSSHRRRCASQKRRHWDPGGPYSAFFVVLAAGGLVLVPKNKEGAGWIHVDTTQETYKKSLEGVVRTIAEECIAAAFRQW